MKVVSLSVLITGLLYPPGTAPGTHFCYKLSPTHGQIAAGRIMSTKTVNPTHDLPNFVGQCIIQLHHREPRILYLADYRDNGQHGNL